MLERRPTLIESALALVLVATVVVLAFLFLGPTVEPFPSDVVCFSVSEPDSPYLQAACPPAVIPTQESDSAVISVELVSESPGWIEGGYFFMRATAMDDEVVLEQKLESADGTAFLPPGRYEFTVYGRSCDGNCGYLDPPSSECTTPISVAANEKLTIAYDWNVPACAAIDPTATPTAASGTYQCTGGAYTTALGSALCERDGQLEVDRSNVPPDVEPVKVRLFGAYEQREGRSTDIPCVHSVSITWNDGEETGWVTDDWCPGPGSPPPSGPPSRALGAAVEGDFFSTDGSPWQIEGVCAAAAGTIFQNGAWVEVRAALEFPVSAPSDDAPITSATLSLRHATGNASEPIAIYGYAGNGTMEAADVLVTGVPITFASAPPVYEHHDVSALLTPDVFAAGWAGFSLRAEPPVFEGSGSGHDFADCQGDVQFPILIIKSLTKDQDEDGDGVADADDVCPGTMPDAFPELHETRYSYDGSVVVSGIGENPPHTIQETGGCSAGQIVAARGLGPLHERYGLGHDALESWIADH